MKGNQFSLFIKQITFFVWILLELSLALNKFKRVNSIINLNAKTQFDSVCLSGEKVKKTASNVRAGEKQIHFTKRKRELLILAFRWPKKVEKSPERARRRI